MQPQPSCLDIDEHRIRVRMKDLRIGDRTHVETDAYYIITRKQTNRVHVYGGGLNSEYASKRHGNDAWADCIEHTIRILTRYDGTPKRCNRCGKTMPRLREHWYTVNSNYNRLNGYCIPCAREYDRERRKAKP